MALERRSGHGRCTRLDFEKRHGGNNITPEGSASRSPVHPSSLTKKIFSTQSEFWPQGGALLGDEAGPVAGSSLRWGAFRSRAASRSQARHHGLTSPCGDARIGAGDRDN